MNAQQREVRVEILIGLRMNGLAVSAHAARGEIQLQREAQKRVDDGMKLLREFNQAYA